MGDTPGSSSAAQSALSEAELAEQAHRTPSSVSQGGLLKRLTTVFTTPPPPPPEANLSPPNLRELDHGMINLRRMRVEDVAIPKVEIIALPVTTAENEVIDTFRQTGLTRLPVYDGTLDTPLGFVHLKDYALQRGLTGSDEAAFDLKAMLRPLLFVPPSMPIGVLLTKMQTERRHMALVIDEYGGVDGLVTIEDLIEQVIGEIEDEHDTEEVDPWIEEKPGQFVALAKTPLDDFEERAGARLTDADEIDAEEVDTLGGLVFMLAGHVPARGEVVRHPQGYEFEVIDADPRRIKRLRVRLAPPAAE